MNSSIFSTDIAEACRVLRRGGIILYPTDTVWGIGCDATSDAAVRRIFDIKRRAESKAMISLVGSIDMLSRWVNPVPEIALELAGVAVEPLTIIYDSPAGLAPSLLAPDGSAAIRLSRNPFCQALCRALKRPVVSTSANISGSPTPRFFKEISPEIVEAVDYVALTGRDDTTPRRPSSVIKISNDSTIKIIRP